MRLNDARCFRLPLPHTRKRMMAIRVMDADHLHVAQDSAAAGPNPAGFGTRTRCRGKTLESKQSSVEIARNEGFEVDQNKEERQDVCIETKAAELLDDPPSLTQREDVPSIVRNESEKLAELPRDAEDDRRGAVREVARDSRQGPRGQDAERSRKSIDRKRKGGDRVVGLEEEKRCRSSWWKDGGQTILQFFARILGKRGGMDARGATGRVLPTGKQPGKRVRRVSRGGRGHNGCGRDVDRGMRLKRVDGYIANRVYRDEGSALTENKSREKQQQRHHHPSILVRIQQIQLTRDKNLRVMLLEQELRARLPKAARRDVYLTEATGINVRQLSSPLC